MRTNKKRTVSKKKEHVFKKFTVTLPARSRINPEAVEALDDYLGAIAPRDFKRRLIFMLLDYLWHAHDQLPDDFRELVDELTLLIMWLEKIEEPT